MPKPTEDVTKLSDIPCAMKGVCAKEQSAYKITGIKVTARSKNPETVWLTATDGLMAAVNVADAPPNDGAIPGDVIPAELLPDNRACCWVERSNGRWYCGDRWYPASDEATKFPPVHEVMPNIANSDGNFNIISLNARMLKRLALAIGDSNGRVTLIIRAHNKPIVVMPRDYGGGLGVMLPVEKPDDALVLNRYATLRDEYIADHKNKKK